MLSRVALNEERASAAGRDIPNAHAAGNALAIRDPLAGAA